ncbi:MAG: argininosuccinate lyase [Actinomycetota bacterium]|nr:argininosuccinate lyase [Actinomycetota bacterium]
MRMWGGRFREPTDPAVEEFGRSIEVDRALAAEDLEGSAAHVRALGRAGLLSADEEQALLEGLDGLRADLDAGRIEWRADLEDVHLNLEAALVERVGSVGDKLHTGRSRNDQVATDLRLHLRRIGAALDARILDLEAALVELAERHADAVMPGTTHLQPAQPVLFAHHLLAYVEMLERDRGRVADACRRGNVSPLGSGAVAGAGFPLDRETTASELGFDGVTRNSIDAVSDRDFVVELLAAAALCAVHLSRLAEELTWWSNPAIGFVRLGDAFSTGSSMMPNKRNPDPAELVRGRAARLTGSLAGVLGVLKGLPLAYQRDLQETVAPFLEAGASLAASLEVMAGSLRSLHVDVERMRAATEAGFLTATAVSDALVERGVSFRTAHRIVGEIVAALEARGETSLTAADDETWRSALSASGDDAVRALADDAATPDLLRAAATVEAALRRPDVVGGTHPDRVAQAVRAVRERIDREVAALLD